MRSNRAPVRAGKPGGSAGDVVGGHDARERHGLPTGPLQAGVLRPQWWRQTRHYRVSCGVNCVSAERVLDRLLLVRSLNFTTCIGRRILILFTRSREGRVNCF